MNDKNLFKLSLIINSQLDIDVSVPISKKKTSIYNIYMCYECTY